eukprot:COSAG02_NODE_6009_length_3878_cov_2.899974_7_plen_48_part_01
MFSTQFSIFSELENSTRILNSTLARPVHARRRGAAAAARRAARGDGAD